MATDRADEIAAEALRQAFAAMHEATGWCGDMLDEHYVAAGPIIAAALRSYGDEKLEAVCVKADALSSHDEGIEADAVWLAAEVIKFARSLKTSPSTQGPRTRIIIPAYRGDIDVTPKPKEGQP